MPQLSFQVSGIHRVLRQLSLNQRGVKCLADLHPQGDPLASPKRNFNLILSSSSNRKVKFKPILPHTHTATFKCVLPLVAARCRSPSTRKLSTMTTTASHSAGLCRAISRPNGRGVRCTCDLSTLMMVIKNSCVPASHHSFMEELEKYLTSFTKRSSGLEFGWRGGGDNIGNRSDGHRFYLTNASPKLAHAAFWMKTKKKHRDVSRQISASVDQGPTGSFHSLQLSREATCWVKPRVTSEHGASWEIQFRLEEMLVGQMSNSMQFSYSWTFSSDAVKWVLALLPPSASPTVLLRL